MDDGYARQGLGKPWKAPQVIIDLAKKQGVETHGKPFKMLGDFYAFVPD